jgi:short-subunit dehydrogenase
MNAVISREKFGPWALITGASSGIGREFAEQIASAGIHVALAARRETQLVEAGRVCSEKFGVQHRVILADLSEEGFIDALVEATQDLDIGLVISNAGSANPGRFLSKEHDELAATLRLSVLAHAEIARRFGRKLTERRSGGILFVGAMGAEAGAPFMAHDGGAKAYVQSLGLALHEEFKSSGVHVAVMLPGPTDTPVLAKFGLDPKTMSIKPMRSSQVVREGLQALSANRSLIVPGRMNRMMRRIVPSSISRSMMMRMFEKMPSKTEPLRQREAE